MILLTKLDNTSIAVCLDAVKYIEEMPDTLVLFLNGDSVIVKESLDSILNQVIKYKAKIVKEAKQ